jgi:hypothetical protein
MELTGAPVAPFRRWGLPGTKDTISICLRLEKLEASIDADRNFLPQQGLSFENRHKNI